MATITKLMCLVCHKPNNHTRNFEREGATRRRSGNYKPPFWDYGYIQSFNSKYSGAKQYMERASELKMEVKKMLEDARSLKPVIDSLELIDDLQRLAISYHFEDEIKKILTSIYERKYMHDHVKNVTTTINDGPNAEKDLYSTALEFRLLRQHRFSIHQEIFDHYKDKKGAFKSSLEKDMKGLLELYEVSHLLMMDEKTLELARGFSTRLLQQNIGFYDQNRGEDENLVHLLVRNALEMPLHWRVQRLNARWFIDVCEKRKDKNLTVLIELAKLDFNIVQATHQEELKEVSRWWKRTCLSEMLPFVRDRLVENYFWTIGVFSEPQHGYQRLMGTKVNALITTIDDIYDVYGTSSELQHFTAVIQRTINIRWDIEAMDELPSYMRLCFLALNNFVNEMAYDVLKEQGVVIIPYLRKSWVDLCTAYLQEAKWYAEGYIPGLEEYINNAWISISAPAILSQAFFLLEDPIKEEILQSLYKYHDIIRCSSMILRLANDLGTSPHEMERGDVPKSIQCYMNETGASEMEAREHIKSLICETWKEMNKERMRNDCPFSEAFVESAVGLGRMAQYMYEHGDGHGIQNSQIKQRISSLLFDPIEY
uniref:Putative (R)-limonene synthase n=1 Tax=Scoparia dulcis TaxID=107240 RepID=A0A5K7Y394_SCODU|nr:putative (R)-limonene synthase [Scoparia dulcis]